MITSRILSSPFQTLAFINNNIYFLSYQPLCFLVFTSFAMTFIIIKCPTICRTFLGKTIKNFSAT